MPQAAFGCLSVDPSLRSETLHRLGSPKRSSHGPAPKTKAPQCSGPQCSGLSTESQTNHVTPNLSPFVTSDPRKPNMMQGFGCYNGLWAIIRREFGA